MDSVLGPSVQLGMKAIHLLASYRVTATDVIKLVAMPNQSSRQRSASIDSGIQRNLSVDLSPFGWGAQIWAILHL